MQVHAGRLKYFYNNWKNITTNPFVLKWVREGYSIQFKNTVNQGKIPQNILSKNEKTCMSLAIKKLLDLGAISLSKQKDDIFISSSFLAPKPNGDKRFILNLKPLNKFIINNHFKMEDHRTVTKLLSVNSFMATVDLKEAYFLVPIAKSCRKYLCFVFEGKIYHFNVLPYGLSVAPRIFTKIMREVMNHLRSKGYRSVIYLDDILCIGDTFSECLRNVTETLNLLERLGFVINWEKSMLVPKQNCKFLGFMFNTIEMSLCLPVDKRNKISKLINIYLTLPKCTIREFSKLIGVLVAACPAIKYGWLYTRSLERAKFLALQQNDDYSTKIKLPKDILPDLRWWNTNITSSNNSLRTQDQFMLEIFSDASKTGWGAFCNGDRVNGGWKDSELSLHINYLELLAVFMGLKCFAKNLSNGSILLRVDNTTAICYINRMGGIQFPHLNDLARSIWQWCEKRNIWLVASYINSLDNIEADQESRKLNIDIEWELSTWAFNNIMETLGTPDIDLFASRVNAKCQRYISWKKDPDAVTVDAFTINWSKYFFYAFPPFSLILKCLNKIINDKASGILVFPHWPGQPWFPLLKTMITSEIIFFEPNPHLLKSRFRSLHPLHQTLTLAAVKLSGTPLSTVTFLA